MFTAAQDQVIALLAAGQTVTAAAAQLDIHRTTIHGWKRTNPDFSDAVRDAQSDAAEEARARYLRHAAAAFETLITLMQDPKAPASVRLKAALHVLNGAAVPAPKPQTKEERRHDRLLRLNLNPATEPDTYAEHKEQHDAQFQAEFAALPEPEQQNSSDFITSGESIAEPQPGPLAAARITEISAYLEQLNADLTAREARLNAIHHNSPPAVMVVAPDVTPAAPSQA